MQQQQKKKHNRDKHNGDKQANLIAIKEKAMNIFTQREVGDCPYSDFLFQTESPKKLRLHTLNKREMRRKRQIQ